VYFNRLPSANRADDGMADEDDIKSRLISVARWPNVDDPRLLMFLRHWANNRKGGVVPARGAIDPAQIAPCLPHVWIYRRDAESGQFICTLAGDEINMAWGRSIIGKKLSNFMPADMARTLDQRYELISTIPAILHSGHQATAQPISGKAARRLIAPIAREDGSPYGVFGISIYVYDRQHDSEIPVRHSSDAVLYDCKVLPATPP